jgi:hypothetical protein
MLELSSFHIFGVQIFMTMGRQAYSTEGLPDIIIGSECVNDSRDCATLEVKL